MLNQNMLDIGSTNMWDIGSNKYGGHWIKEYVGHWLKNMWDIGSTNMWLTPHYLPRRQDLYSVNAAWGIWIHKLMCMNASVFCFTGCSPCCSSPCGRAHEKHPTRRMIQLQSLWASTQETSHKEDDTAVQTCISYRALLCGSSRSLTVRKHVSSCT